MLQVTQTIFLKNQLKKFRIEKLIILSRNTDFLKKKFKTEGNSKIISRTSYVKITFRRFPSVIER